MVAASAWLDSAPLVSSHATQCIGDAAAHVYRDASGRAHAPQLPRGGEAALGRRCRRGRSRRCMTHASTAIRRLVCDHVAEGKGPEAVAMCVPRSP
jgi:hypothetical protein